MAKMGKKTLPKGFKKALEMPVTMEEMRLAVGKGGVHEAPGSDDIKQEFFKATWETTKNHINLIFV